eukprot:scaffold1169_cov367-Prasinococcus_capsulatus_cf.AAC.10
MDRRGPQELRATSPKKGSNARLQGRTGPAAGGFWPLPRGLQQHYFVHFELAASPNDPIDHAPRCRPPRTRARRPSAGLPPLPAGRGGASGAASPPPPGLPT